MGDIPMTQALQGSANLTPAYDNQKTVFKMALALLDTANTNIGGLLAKADNTLAGDIFYNNDLRKWQKAVNTFKLRLLIHLSKKVATDADLNIAQQFAAKLLDEGIYVTGFFYPVVAKGQARIRVQLSAAHEKEHLDKALAAFEKVGKELGVIK